MTTPPDTRTTRPTVVKLGGSTLGARDTSLLDIAAAHADGRPIAVVHGGGAAVTEWLKRSGIEARFANGLRVTDSATLEVVVAVLAGTVNKMLVAELSNLGARAFGLSGADGGLLLAHQYDPDLGLVGLIDTVEPAPINALLRDGYLPVIAPIAIEPESGVLLNTNADTAAGAIAAALNAERLIFLTDVEGVLDAKKRLVPRLTADDARAMIANGTAADGMIPKLEAAIAAASSGCPTRIINGTTEGALSAVLQGSDTGTTVVA